MKRLLTLLFTIISLQLFAQTQSSLPVGSIPYGSVYLAPDGSVWAGANGKTFKNIGLKENISRLDDSITALRTSINGKVDKITGKGLSTEDYSTSEKSKLAGIASGATANRSDAATDLLFDAKINLTEKGAVNGVATLNSLGKIPNVQIPALALVDTYVAGSQAAMLALSTAEQGDVAIRTDLSKTFILTDASYSTLASWKELLSPVIPAETDPVWGASPSAGITAGNISNWNTAFSQTRQWDGGATGLVAATGRTSLGLGSGVTYDASTGSTPATLALRDGSGSSAFKSITVDTDGGLALTSSSQTNGQVLATWKNTAGWLKWGVENSVGGNYLTGSDPYSSFFGTATNTSLHFGTNGITRFSISGAGAIVSTGTITAPAFIGNASTVTGGVYTTGLQTIAGNKTFSDATTINHNLVLNPSSNPALWYRASGATKWITDASGDASANWQLGRYNDSQIFQGFTISANRSTGAVTLENNLTAGGVITASANTSNIGLKIIGTASGGGGGTYYYGNDGTTLKGYMGVSGTSMGIINYENGPIFWGTNSSEYARISSTGDFSIGTSSGGYKLNVAGAGNFSGSLTVGGYIINPTIYEEPVEITSGITYSLYSSWPLGSGSVTTETRNYDTSTGVKGTNSDADADNENHGVVFDLGSSKIARRIVIWTDAPKNLDTWRVDYSSDGSTWTTLKTFPAVTARTVNMFDFNRDKQISARYWRWAINGWTQARQVANFYFYESAIYE